MIEKSVTFENKMRMSEGASNKKEIVDIILEHFPNAVSVERANSSDDRNGTDFWVTMQSGEKESVDVKVREEDWLKKNGKDDVALETWSVIGKKIGWTRDVNKRTNWIFFLWKDTGRNMLVPFPMLCSIFVKNCEEWCKKYKPSIQNTENRWKSECIFVPRLVVWREIYNAFGGAPARQVTTQVSLAENVKKVPKCYNPRVDE